MSHNTPTEGKNLRWQKRRVTKGGMSGTLTVSSLKDPFVDSDSPEKYKQLWKGGGALQTFTLVTWLVNRGFLWGLRFS